MCGLQPKFGQGREAGLTLGEFQTLYEADEFYSWFGLSSPLMYAAHKAAGGMTSIYRQIGIGCQWVFAEMLQEHLGLTANAANWSYTIKARGKKLRRLSLDGRIPLAEIRDSSSAKRVQQWLAGAAKEVGLPRSTLSNLQGCVFEVRQGYKSKDSKRQNADVANTANAYAHQYLPIVVLLSSQIDDDVAKRYERAQWLLLRGTTRGTAHSSVYVFCREIVGYDLAAFFQRNSTTLKTHIEGASKNYCVNIDGQTFLFAESSAVDAPSKQRAHLTFKANIALGRHNWLRLTPAYSRQLVEQLVRPLGKRDRVLDPFCSTGTTALTCAEHGIRADTVDINPFLVWLANAKFANYSVANLAEAEDFLVRLSLDESTDPRWLPPLADIEKWWSPEELRALAALCHAIKEAAISSHARNLLFSAFCQVAIEVAAVSFGHQSMSFKPRPADRVMVSPSAGAHITGLFRRRLAHVISAARTALDGSLASAHLGDSRNLHTTLRAKYSCVITSPPYPNRMSYIRELRPYMYWLGYLESGRQTGELDWQAIGGTWGCATSNLNRWEPDSKAPVPFTGFDAILTGIRQRSDLLARYVHKYFEDCVHHFRSLARVLRDDATAHYIVGNSKFYDTMVPTEEIYAALMRAHGFTRVRIENIRKRNSKKELFEFVVSGNFTR